MSAVKPAHQSSSLRGPAGHAGGPSRLRGWNAVLVQPLCLLARIAGHDHADGEQAVSATSRSL